jgi:hypothetical protein
VPDALGDVSEAECELVLEDGVSTSFFDRREVLSRDVLDEREQKRIAVIALPYQSGHGCEPRGSGRSPAAFAGDELVCPLIERSDEDRLDDPSDAHRVHQAGDPVAVESPWLSSIRSNGSDRKLYESRWARAIPEQDLETSAEASPRLGAVGIRDGR